MVYLTLLAGFALLIIGGDILIRGAVAMAEKLNIPKLVIGLTVIAFGTSAPELMVSVQAALNDKGGIAIGNVVGSNIANILLVLGLPSILLATGCNQPFVKENTLILILVTLLFIAMCLMGTLHIWHGIILLILLGAFLYLQMHRVAMHQEDQAAILGDETLEMLEHSIWLPSSGWQIALTLIIGIITLPIGAQLTIDSASLIASSFGVSDAVIALTVIALGTSLPELAAVLPAALRGESGLAIGNVIGSNLFNILAVMGITATITHVPVDPKFVQLDLWIMLAVTLLLLPLVYFLHKISRITGAVFFAAYIVYILTSLGGSPFTVANSHRSTEPVATQESLNIRVFSKVAMEQHVF